MTTEAQSKSERAIRAIKDFQAGKISRAEAVSLLMELGAGIKDAITMTSLPPECTEIQKTTERPSSN